MPRPSNYPEPPADLDLEAYLDLCREFCDGFRRSSKGNLWQRWNDDTVTIFAKDGSYKWCIADGEGGTRYSDDRFRDEDQAKDSLCFVLLM